MPQTHFTNWDLNLQLQSWNLCNNWKCREFYASYFGILSNFKFKSSKKFWLQSYLVTSVKEILCCQVMFSFQCEIILFKWISIYRTALLLAIQNGYMDLSEKLIDSASNLNLQDSNGRYAYVYVI